MTEFKEKRPYLSLINRTCLGANTVYVVLHIFYFVMFLIAKAWIAFYINIASIVIYCLFYFLIRKEKFHLYALLCGNEFFIFVSSAAVLLGFTSGFQLMLIGLCAISFFSTYFSPAKDVRGSVIWSGLCAAIFLTLYFYTRFKEPIYEIPTWMEQTFFVIHSVAAFSMIAIYLVLFVNYTTKLEKRVKNESRTDELTQIANRYGLYDRLDSITDKSSYLIAIFDIDDFKKINDTYGHVFGDHILQDIAKIASNTVGEGFVCRYGGEEFVVLLPHSLSNFTSLETLENIRKTIEVNEFTFEGKSVRLSVTIGAALYEKGLSIEKWLERADRKLYEGKNSGKNKICF